MSETRSSDLRVNLETAKRPIDPGGESDLATLNSKQKWFISWVTDILVYVVVLNLFDEFVEGIHIGSFWESVLAAILMKALLVIVGEVESRVHHYFKERGQVILMVLGIWAVLFFGKLAIITIIDSIFENVSFHGLLTEIALILTMIIASAVVWLIFDKLGTDVDSARREDQTASHA